MVAIEGSRSSSLSSSSAFGVRIVPIATAEASELGGRKLGVVELCLLQRARLMRAGEEVLKAGGRVTRSGYARSGIFILEVVVVVLRFPV
jgi:hypothetical protein